MDGTTTKKLTFQEKMQKGFNKGTAYLSKPHNVITIIFLVILVATVVFPLITLLRDSVVIHYGGEAEEFGKLPGSFTLYHWRDILFNPTGKYSVNTFYKPLLNSIGMALFACLIAIGFGGALAFFITRTDMPFKKLISMFFIFPYIMPSWSIAMFWENFFKNSSIDTCYNQSGMLEAITTLKVPEWMVYGWFPMAMVLGIHYAPFAYILIGGILRNMDANLEEAATILKASRFKVLRRVTLPIVMPGIISTLLLVFSSSIASFTVPYFLNKNMSFMTISQQMRALLQSSSEVGQGFAIAIILIIISLVILTANSLITGKRKSFTTISGKSGQVSVIKLRKFKYVVGVFFGFIVLFFSLVPLISFGLESFLGTAGDINSFTTYYWTTSEQIETRINGSSAGIFKNPTVWLALARSIGLSFVVALIAGTSGILIGYAVSRKRGSKMTGFMANLAFLPYLIPTLSFGATYFALTYSKGFGWLRGTFIILVLIGSVKFLPFASKSGTNSMLQLSKEIEEAAIMAGIPWWKRMTKVLFPIQKASFFSGYLLPFISTMREYTLFVLIAGPTSLITIIIKEFDVSGVTQISNGINFLMMIVIITLNFAISKITGASIDKGIGG